MENRMELTPEEEFLIKFNPSFKTQNIKQTNTFGGEFLLYMMKQYADMKVEEYKKPIRQSFLYQ